MKWIAICFNVIAVILASPFVFSLWLFNFHFKVYSSGVLIAIYSRKDGLVRP
jgi:hypothetical protein